MGRMLPLVLVLVLGAACGRIGFHGQGDGDGGTNGGGDGDGGTQVRDGNRPDIMFTSNVVFVTGAVATPSSFGGLQAADHICQSAADQASLPGTYIAWLSTTTTNAVDRLAGSRGWVRTDGTPFADQPSDIAAGTVWSPISLAADGTDLAFADQVVVTGTTAAGAASSNCSDWTTSTTTVMTGRLTTSDGTWTSSVISNTACAAPSRLYCFGVGNQVAVAPPMVTGRRAFYSKPVPSGGGIGAFDSRCQTDADAAGLGGTFRAFVATTTATAISRFDTTKARWERLDGVPLGQTAADLAVGLHAPLNTYADGTYYNDSFGIAKAWTGAGDPSTLGATSCSNWTSTAPSLDGIMGHPTYAAVYGFKYGMRRCDDTTYGVYCLEL